ncbi:MAG TPA: UDP-N-acetylmuramoyl-L-alanyl-D-glutamate--2,6-diaminopimelate ligase, partial [Polyangiaceae bacterium]
MMAPTESSSTRAGISLEALAHALARHAPRLVGDATQRVFGIHQDSRLVERGDLFVARAGQRANGAAFAQGAVARGAVAVLAERAQPLPAVAVPLLEVDDAARALSSAAEAIYGEPSRSLAVVGITGTNGKTTTTWLVEHALAKCGSVPARLGTLGYTFAGSETDLGMTTPGADDVSRLLARTRDAGGTHFVMEVSSHALAQARVSALQFEVAAFSNLTLDHLDFHGSLAEYGAAKALLFTELAPRHSVVNIDDPFGVKLAERAQGRVLRVSKRAPADLYPSAVSVGPDGIRGNIVTPEGDMLLASRLVGEHNLDNLLLAAGILLALGVAPAEIGAALSASPQVPGRLERCDEPSDDLPVLVDYAHTPDALARVLESIRAGTRTICVFGCGGDRDPTKR